MPYEGGLSSIESLPISQGEKDAIFSRNARGILNKLGGALDRLASRLTPIAPVALLAPDSLAYHQAMPHVGRVMRVGRWLLYLATLVALGLVAAASATAHAASF